MKNSVVSYLDRGPYGKSSYRGNVTGYLIKDYLTKFHKSGKLFVDPAEGSGTSRDVAKELNIKYVGLDLKTGFNIISDILLEKIGSHANTIFFHPPYHSMIKYSTNKHDLSNATSVEDFLAKLQLAFINIYDALEYGGHYGFLIGNIRKDGKYIPLGSYASVIAPGVLKEEIIKIQHNCRSSLHTYKGNGFIPIAHEKFYIFTKEHNMIFEINMAITLSERFRRIENFTWKNLLVSVFKKYKSSLTLSEIYKAVGNSYKTDTNRFWKEKIRQTLQLHKEFIRIDRGSYYLA